MRRFTDEAVGVEAAGLVEGDRQEAYGDPLDNYDRFAVLLSGLFGIEVSRRQAITVMILVKVSRDASRPLRDNEVDICGYAHILQMDREENDFGLTGEDDPIEDARR